MAEKVRKAWQNQFSPHGTGHFPRYEHKYFKCHFFPGKCCLFWGKLCCSVDSCAVRHWCCWCNLRHWTYKRLNPGQPGVTSQWPWSPRGSWGHCHRLRGNPQNVCLNDDLRHLFYTFQQCLPHTTQCKDLAQCKEKAVHKSVNRAHNVGIAVS